jgi:hypothetical protein
MGEKGGSGKTRQVDAKGDSDKAEGVPAPMSCVTNSVKEVENDGASRKFFRKREMRKKARQKESQKQKNGAQGTKPRQSLSKGQEGLTDNGYIPVPESFKGKLTTAIDAIS